MPDQDETIIRNYAGRLNGKAVDILNSINEYNLQSKRHELDEAVNLLKKALLTVNPLCRMQITKPYELIDELQYINQYAIDDVARKLDDDLLKLLVKHLYIAKKYHSYN